MLELDKELEKILVNTNYFILAKKENGEEFIVDTLYKYSDDIIFIYRKRQIRRGELNIDNPNIIKIYLKNISSIKNKTHNEYIVTYNNGNIFEFKKNLN